MWTYAKSYKSAECKTCVKLKVKVKYDCRSGSSQLRFVSNNTDSVIYINFELHWYTIHTNTLRVYLEIETIFKNCFQRLKFHQINWWIELWITEQVFRQNVITIKASIEFIYLMNLILIFINWFWYLISLKILF
jgi:hypothetical protein